MSSNWKRLCTCETIINISTLVLGVFMVIWPQISAAMVCYILGILFLSIGIFEIIRYYSFNRTFGIFQYDIFRGICSILIGCLLIIHPLNVVCLLQFSLGIYLFFGSVFGFHVAIRLRNLKIKVWCLILVLSIINAVLGLLMLFNPFNTVKIFVVVIGISMVTFSIQRLYILHCISESIIKTTRNSVIDLDE